MKVKRKYLYLTAALIWGLPGIAITVKGVTAYTLVPPSLTCFLLILTGCVLTMFHLIFRQMVRRYSERIAALSERSPLWQTFPPRGWGILLFMMGLGIAIRHIPGIPTPFIAFFYSGLGPMLVLSAIRFLQRM